MAEEPARCRLVRGVRIHRGRDGALSDVRALAPATAAHYDQAIHLNRRAPFGIVEIQVLTFDLYRRAHCDPSVQGRRPGRTRLTVRSRPTREFPG